MTYAKDMDSGLAPSLRVAVMRLRRRLASERDPHNDLSLSAMAVLGGLFKEGEMTLGQLADREKVQPPSMTRTVNCLEEGGYVTRRPSETDKRVVLVSITDHGRETVTADRARRDSWLSHRLAELTPAERDILHRAAPILEKLAMGE